jgi:hypothetical protein
MRPLAFLAASMPTSCQWLISCSAEQMASERTRFSVVAWPNRCSSRRAHRVGGTAAIVHQFVEVLVTFLVDVLDEGIKQIAEQLQGQAVGGDDRAQAQEDRVLRRPAGFDGVEFRLVAGEQLAALRGAEAALVGEIVGAAGEPVDRRHRLAQARGQQERGDGKVLVVVYSHLWDRGSGIRDQNSTAPGGDPNTDP